MKEIILCEFEVMEERTLASTVGRNSIVLTVDNEEDFGSNIPYFKAYRCKNKDKEKLIRLHFRDNGYEVHYKSSNSIWKFNKRQATAIMNLMKDLNNSKPYTNWQVGCYSWNYVNNFFAHEPGGTLFDTCIDDYMKGKYDSKFRNIIGYLPSAQAMPKLWEYKGLKPELKSIYMDLPWECDMDL